MSQELQLGKYEFYPYPKEFREPPPTLDELVELLRKAKARSAKHVKTPSHLSRQRQLRRKRRGGSTNRG